MDQKEREAFENIKESVAEAPTLRILNFDNEFILYTFASNHSIVVVLTQKNEEGGEFLAQVYKVLKWNIQQLTNKPLCCLKLWSISSHIYWNTIPRSLFLIYRSNIYWFRKNKETDGETGLPLYKNMN